MLDFKSGETILSKTFPLETSAVRVKLEAQKVAHGFSWGALATASSADISFDACIESDVVLRLTDEHAYSKLEIGTVAISCVIPHDSTSLADALDLAKVLYFESIQLSKPHLHFISSSSGASSMFSAHSQIFSFVHEYIIFFFFFLFSLFF